MRLIDADELNFGKYKGIPIIGDILIGLNDVAKELKAAPTIDALPVVRCKDCQHLKFSDCYGECSKGYLGIVQPNDYCSRGGRKETDEVHRC